MGKYKKYERYSLKFVLLSLAFSIIYFVCADKNLAYGIIYIVIFVLIAQANNLIAAHRGDTYIKNNYKELYKAYHKDYLFTPDNIVPQIIFNAKKSDITKESSAEKSAFRKDINYDVIKSESLIAMAHGLLAVLYGFIYLAVSFVCSR